MPYVHRRFITICFDSSCLCERRWGEYENLFNKDLIELGLARTTFSHAYRREFERLRKERGTGLWGAYYDA